VGAEARESASRLPCCHLRGADRHRHGWHLHRLRRDGRRRADHHRQGLLDTARTRKSSGSAIPTAPGLAGGYPAATNAYRFKRNTCGRLIENEVCRAQDPVLWDIELRVE